MGHTFYPVTKADNLYSPLSNVTSSGTLIEEKLTWFIINPLYDTWDEFNDYGRTRWCDWYFADYAIITPSGTYNIVTKEDNLFNQVTTPALNYSEVSNPSKTYTLVTKEDNAFVQVSTPVVTFTAVTNPSRTFNAITKGDNSFNQVTVPTSSYSEVTK
jgi:hypothetical protein